MFTNLKRRVRAFPQRHPVLWQVLLWSLPALIFGAFLRGLLLSYSPYAYWGSDSRSYFGFSTGVVNDFYFSLNEKRRFLYPIFLLPVTLLPGSTLRWVAWIQPALGLLSLLPAAYVVRRVFTGWKLWIIPITLIYSSLPIFLWYEHELLAEWLFFSAITWAIGGWMAWVRTPDGARKSAMWWWFFIPLAIALLTKPAGRFLLPGLVLALLAVRAWRYLRWRELLAGAALLGLTSAMGDDDQGTWLLYTSAFPFTQLETPRHADYKKEVEDLVRFARADLMRFADEDSEVFLFLRDPRKQDERPLWKKLGEDEHLRTKIYRELALEAIAAEPLPFLSLSLDRILASANPEEFELKRFEADYFGSRFLEAYERHGKSVAMMQLAFGYRKGEPFPSKDWFATQLTPHPHSRAAQWLENFCATYERAGRLFKIADPRDSGTRTTLRPTLFGWFVIATAVAALVAYFPTIGLWMVVAGGYLVGVFLVGVQHPRYFAAVWPMVIVALPALPDAILRVVGKWRRTAPDGPA